MVAVVTPTNAEPIVSHEQQKACLVNPYIPVQGVAWKGSEDAAGFQNDNQHELLAGSSRSASMRPLPKRFSKKSKLNP